MTEREPPHTASTDMSAIHHRADRRVWPIEMSISRRPTSARSIVETYTRTRSLPRMGLGLTLTVPRCAISGGARVSLAHIRAPAGVPVIAGSRIVVDPRRRVDPHDGV